MQQEILRDTRVEFVAVVDPLKDEVSEVKNRVQKLELKTVDTGVFAVFRRLSLPQVGGFIGRMLGGGGGGGGIGGNAGNSRADDRGIPGQQPNNPSMYQKV